MKCAMTKSALASGVASALASGVAFGLASLFVIAGLSGLTACTVRTPTTETPVPNDQGVEKTFFVETVSGIDAQGVATITLKRKTFLCGWAPISESSADASQVMTHAVHMAGHCNMEFEITKNALIGRMVNPTFPNDRTRWKQAITIPIRKHYYYERAKDAYGRETNEFVENSSRSDFSARPMMDLDLEGISIEDWDIAMFGNSRSGKVSSVQDVEWDKANGFLGFTATVTNPAWGAAVGARLRFNFKTFTHNENFQTTPYSPLNSAYFNALHVMGEKVERHQIWTAAKWDLSKPHDIYTYGFSASNLPIARKVIDQWNAAFTSIGKPAAFRLNEKKMKYPFDLRYPMMVWIDDVQISSQSPLGIGMAQADVRNGELLWGQITLYGGELERYIKSHVGSGGDSANSKTGGVRNSPAYFQTYFNPTKSLQPPPQIDQRGIERFAAKIQSLSPKFDGLAILKSKLADMQKAIYPRALAASDIEIAKEQARTELGAFVSRQESTLRETLGKSTETSLGEIQARVGSTEGFRKNTLKLFGFAGTPSVETRRQAFGENEAGLSDREKLAMLTSSAAEKLKGVSAGVVFDTDRRFSDVGPALVAGFAKTGVTYEAGLRKVILELILHEFGHMLGLGHQFKENILPAPGTVPEKYLVQLRKGVANNLTNATSVMGYKHPLTELTEDEDSIAPGPQDLLTLRYLYNGEYATFRRGSGDADFSFAKVPASGMIPASDPNRASYVTSYFPQCNDFDASFGTDPFCNRFDRGNDAPSIVKNYFDDLNTNLVSRIYAFTDVRGGNTEEAEAELSWRALTTLGRVRTFFDYMRQQFETEIRSISNSERDLYEFSRVCTGELEGSASLQKIFADKPELKELCKVNRMAVREMTNFLAIPGPDRARMNWDNASTPGGMTGGDADSDWSRVWGTHTALSVMPLKLAAMNALTTPWPYTMYGSWMFPIQRFAGSDGLFSYSTLYPVEFSEAIAASVEKNLRFNSASGNSGTMGMPIMSMGYFLDQQNYGNDATRMPKDFITNIRNQTSFRLSVKALILNLQTRDDQLRVTNFETLLYDPNNDQSQRMLESFVLPGGKLIVRAPTRNFVSPISKIMFLSDKMAFAWAYHIEYDDKYDDVLAAHSAKATLEKLNNSILDGCIRGNNNGLASHFNAQKDPKIFPGFMVMSGIANEKEKQLRFLESVRENFQTYAKASDVKLAESGIPLRCEQTLDGVSMLVSTAAVLNGYFLPEVLDYLVK